MPAGLNPASLRKLANVKSDLVKVCERAAEISGTPFQIVQGHRTKAEQQRLYEQGRTRPGPIVTWTLNSKHLGGNAIDFAALVGGKINWNTIHYPKIAEAFKQAARELGIGIEWGGDWKTKDWGHVQLSAKSPTPTKPTAGIGWTITDIQTALIKHGFKPGMVDGIMGPKTRAALKAFQKAQGLEETGGPDRGTTDALAKEPAPAAKSEAVKAIQEKGPRWAVDQLVGMGWSQRDAIVWVAHLMWESGGHGKNAINWLAKGDGGNSKGGGQWNKGAGRWQALDDFAAARGSTWEDPLTQLQFMNDELNRSERRAARDVRNAPDFESAVRAGLRYWRPGKPHIDKRLQVANKLNKEFSA